MRKRKLEEGEAMTAMEVVAGGQRDKKAGNKLGPHQWSGKVVCGAKTRTSSLESRTTPHTWPHQPLRTSQVSK